MSFDAGGLAQMTFNNNNNFPVGSGIGVPSAGYASRGKGSGLKRLSVSNTTEEVADGNATPRTSRGHLLAGLRTAPKGQAPPASAPYNRSQHQHGPDGSKFKHQAYGSGQAVPQTASASSFHMNRGSQYGAPAHHQQNGYSGYEQVLAPPSLQLDAEDEQIDPAMMAQLLQTEAYLAHRQRMLQQQLLTLTSQQFQGMNINAALQGVPRFQQFPNTPMTGPLPGLNQQIQPTVQEVPGQPGVYLVYNPVTGESGYVMDQMMGQNPAASSPPTANPGFGNSPPARQTPPHQMNPASPVDGYFPQRIVTPPKKTPSPPADVQPLPPPSANAFRPGQKLNRSTGSDRKTVATPDGIKSTPRTAGFPHTPSTGTFGPGQNRAGEHPVRQPRGPPQLEELVAKPTSKHEGSKNFVTRQRRSAVSSLVRKGIARRGVRSASGDSYTAGSETESGYYMLSDDSDSVHSSASQSRKISVGTIRSNASGVIGSERKARKDRFIDQLESKDARSSSHNAVGEFKRSISILGEDIIEEPPKTSTPGAADRMKTPLLVLTKAEKRKTSVF